MIEFIVRLSPVILLGLEVLLMALLFAARSVKVLRAIEWSLCNYLGPGPAVFRLFRLGVPGSLVDIRNTPQPGSGSLIPICSRDLAASPHYHHYSDPQRAHLSCSSCTIARPGTALAD